MYIAEERLGKVEDGREETIRCSTEKQRDGKYEAKKKRFQGSSEKI